MVDPVRRTDLELTTWCARQIEDYWAQRGFAVVAEVVPSGSEKLASVFGVRSNTLNGLPRHRLEASA